MTTRPFLSHKRQDRDAVVVLKRTLATYGVGGWRDLDDLQLGELSQPGFQRAINDVTGGCLWYGTKRVLGSWYVNNIELPAIVARKRREPSYPLVPLFVTVSPGVAKNALLDVARTPGSALNEDDVEVLMDANGFARERGQSSSDFRVAVARRYVPAAVASLAQEGYSVAIAALAEPAGSQDFTFDWRELIDPTKRVLADGATLAMTDALRTFRDAVRPAADFPELTLDVDIPLPLAALVGYEWRVTSRLRLTTRQRTRSGIVVVEGDGPTVKRFPPWVEKTVAQTGPTVLAVSTTQHPPDAPAATYAAGVGAARTVTLHVPGELDACSIRGLARHVADALRRVNDAGEEKHLLLAGPTSLALLIGAAANAAGPVTMPFWDGSGYVSPLVIAA